MRPEEALIDSTVIVDAPIDVVSELILHPEVIERYMLAIMVEPVAAARGRQLGSVFHCHHGHESIFLQSAATKGAN